MRCKDAAYYRPIMDYPIPPTSPASIEALQRHPLQWEGYGLETPQPEPKEEPEMSEGIMDKVNINVGEGRGGDGGNMAAVIAALGNRNQGNDNAALIAALGNRNDSAANLGPLLAMLGNRRDDDGLNSMWPLLLLLLGRGRGGFGGGDDCGSGGAETRIEDQAATLAIMNKLGTIEAAIPLASAQTENVILQQTNAITNLAHQSQLANAAGFANTNDVIQRNSAAQLVATNNVNQNVLEQGCETRAVIEAAKTEILSKLSQNEIDRLRHERDGFQRQVEIQSLRSQVEVNQTVNTVQAQSQEQRQRQSDNYDLHRRLDALIIGNQFVANRQGQDVINFGGTMTASGTQAAANTAVR